MGGYKPVRGYWASPGERTWLGLGCNGGQRAERSSEASRTRRCVDHLDRAGRTAREARSKAHLGSLAWAPEASLDQELCEGGVLRVYLCPRPASGGRHVIGSKCGLVTVAADSQS